jgi:hypothetical protein
MKAESPVNQREAGKVVSGGDDRNDGREIFQPDTGTATGASGGSRPGRLSAVAAHGVARI